VAYDDYMNIINIPMCAQKITFACFRNQKGHVNFNKEVPQSLGRWIVTTCVFVTLKKL